MLIVDTLSVKIKRTESTFQCRTVYDKKDTCVFLSVKNNGEQFGNGHEVHKVHAALCDRNICGECKFLLFFY